MNTLSTVSWIDGAGWLLALLVFGVVLVLLSYIPKKS